MFNNKEEFKKEYKDRIVQAYGRSLEQAHKTEQYLVLGDMVRQKSKLNKCSISLWNF